MDGPMTGVNPDQVEGEVGNFWRSLYKLEKQFEGIAAPKKIAAKVSTQTSCYFIWQNLLMKYWWNAL
jgi:dynein heavy chain